MYGIYPTQSCSVRIAEIQGVCSLALSTFTGSIHASQEIGKLTEDQAMGLIDKLASFVNSASNIIDLDLFLKEYIND